MRTLKQLRSEISRALPRLTAREWGAIAELAASAAGLSDDEVDALRTALRDTRRDRCARSRRQMFRPGDPVRRCGYADGQVMTVEEYRPGLVPKEVLVIWADPSGVQYEGTFPPDVLELAR